MRLARILGQAHYADRMMPLRQLQSMAGGTVLGPCPGCDNWTLDWPRDTEQQFVRMEFIDGELRVNMTEWKLVVEAILREHYDECPALRELVGPL